MSGQIPRTDMILASAGWCLIYTTLSLDPALRDKIEAARSLTGMIGDARKIR